MSNKKNKEKVVDKPIDVGVGKKPRALAIGWLWIGLLVVTSMVAYIIWYIWW